ncbi:hypothetical protein Hdeb2414_s0001g00007531 [Helianthus debilis subsp. tardiflorus]
MWWLEVEGDAGFKFTAGTYSLLFEFQLSTPDGQHAVSKCFESARSIFVFYFSHLRLTDDGRGMVSEVESHALFHKNSPEMRIISTYPETTGLILPLEHLTFC